MIFAYPLEFFPGSTAPKNPALFEQAQEFCVTEFGERQNLNDGAKTWVVVDREGEKEEILAIGTFRVALDIPRFHVKAAADDNEKARDKARKARDTLTGRMWSYAQDTYGPERELFVFIDPKAERYWKSYLRMIGAKPAERYKLIV